MRRILAAVLVAAAVAPCSASAVTLTGRASTYGSDPVTGYVDAGDNNIPALAAASNARPGIAVMRWDTLGHWWRVCTPAKRCRWARQTDVGPRPDTGRVLDVNATAARVLWGLPQGDAFPTDVGRWWLRSHGRQLTRSQLHAARYERCRTRRCRSRWAPHRRRHAALERRSRRAL